jgi:hypothetical protein
MQSQIDESLKQMEQGQEMMIKFSMPGAKPVVVKSESVTLAVGKVTSLQYCQFSLFRLYWFPERTLLAI